MRRGGGRGVAAVLVVAVLVSGGCGGGERGAGGTGAPGPTVRALLGAIDRGDADAAMSLLAPGFVMGTWDGTPLVFRDGYAEVLGWDVAADGARRVERSEAEGDTVTLRLVERNRFTELLDLGPFHMDVRYVVRDGRVVEQHLRERTQEGARSYAERFREALEPVLAWAVSAAPGLLAQATEDGAVTYNGEAAAALLELIQLYREREGTASD